jgi:hypothetical protein
LFCLFFPIDSANLNTFILFRKNLDIPESQAGKAVTHFAEWLGAILPLQNKGMALRGTHLVQFSLLVLVIFLFCFCFFFLNVIWPWLVWYVTA